MTPTSATPEVVRAEFATAADGTPVVRAEFATAADGTPDGDFVEREAPVLFRAGTYEFPDQPPFEMTADDIRAAVAAFSPVQIEDNHRPDVIEDKHRPSYFKGKLGTVAALAPGADFTSLGAKLRVPKWLHDVYKGQPIGLSATWDRLTKRLKDVSITHTPRISDAVLFAAFSADEAQKEVAARHFTPHGQKLLQFIHDHAAMAGAKCPPGAGTAAMSAEGGPAGDAAFTADHEAASIQRIHDLTLGSGAQCAIYREGMARNQDWKPGQYADSTVEMLPRYRDYRPGSYAAMSADAPPPPAGEPEMTPREKDLAAQLARVKAEKDREAAARKDAEFSAAVGRAAGEALLFAQSLVGKHILPAQQKACVDDLRQAAIDDLRHAGEVTFSDDRGRERRGTRLDAAKARWLGLDVSHLTQERVKDAHFTLPADAGLGGTQWDDERRRVEEWAERHNRRGPRAHDGAGQRR